MGDKSLDSVVDQQVSRQKRFLSHTFVEVRRFKHLPIFCHSAVLLDISLAGFKLEFTGEVSVQPGSQHWLVIPLTPLGIASPTSLVCHSECRWFDATRFRIGGIFLDLNRPQLALIEQIVTSLKNRSQL